MSHYKSHNFHKTQQESKPVEKENVEEAVDTAPVEETESAIKEEFELPEDKAGEVASEFMTPPEEPESVFGEVICDRLRIREKPSTESDTIGILSIGDTVMIEENDPNSDFYKILIPIDKVHDLSTDSEYGYCMKQFIKVAAQ